MINVLSVPHQVTRLVFDTGQPYEKFRSRYEAAVPPVDPRRLGDFAGRHDLDYQLAELLKALGVGATEVLCTAGLAGHRC